MEVKCVHHWLTSAQIRQVEEQSTGETEVENNLEALETIVEKVKELKIDEEECAAREEKNEYEAKLQEAITRGDLAALRTFFESTPAEVELDGPKSGKHELSFSPLYFSVSQGQLELVKYLVGLTVADLNTLSVSEQQTPLHW